MYSKFSVTSQSTVQLVLSGAECSSSSDAPLNVYCVVHDVTANVDLFVYDEGGISSVSEEELSVSSGDFTLYVGHVYEITVVFGAGSGLGSQAWWDNANIRFYMH